MRFLSLTNIKLIHLLLFILLLLFSLSNGELLISALAYSYTDDDQIITPLIKKFNEYSKNNNLNIKVKLNIITPSNSTVYISDYGTTIETLLSKKSDKYDIYFYDNVYTKRYGKYFVNFKKKIPQEHLNMYKSEFSSDLYISNDRWVGLPVQVDYRVLYVNMDLLNKYNMEIPRTWDELIKTGRYIYDEEAKNNPNNDLSIYNGSLDADESGTSTTIEFIYSFRKSKKDPPPEFNSPEAIEALEKLKELKNRISSDEEFSQYGSYVFSKLFNGKSIFLKYWYTNSHPVYKKVPLPGRIEGISTSCLGGNNIAVSIFSSKEKQDAAVKVVEFITSKDIKKEFSIKNDLYSGIASLYDDEEVCSSKIDCELFKNLQPVVRPTRENEDYDEFSLNFRNYIYEYIFGNKSAEEVLNNVVNLRKVYMISLDTKDSPIGLISFILLCLLSCIMILSIIFVFIPTFKLQDFLPSDFWILLMMGIIMVFSMSFTEIGEITKLNCHLRLFLFSFGFLLNMITVLYKLIICFPEENKFSIWVGKHRYIFISLFIFINMIINFLFLLHPYDIKDVQEDNGKHFKICKLNHMSSISIKYILIFFMSLILLNIIILVFLEWNIKSTFLDIRMFISSIYIDILSFILFIIIELYEIRNYIGYFIIRIIIYSVYGVSNFIFMFFYKIIYYYIKKSSENKEEGINTIINNLKNEIDISSEKASTSRFISTKRSEIGETSNRSSTYQSYLQHRRSLSFYNKILNYHSRQEIGRSSCSTVTNNDHTSNERSNN
ncbi:periplasmic binding protein-like II [Piromyces finnis]|uniref:Periplasmic binding protein-like II n=1 Tax=Piromyces finnis TaxID=1754191 RepID=A0A1Y1VA40_9FUNG|nr:periplasmic binding protein-like II [Piromyces finnis]|eukprot:ORX49624.1 periplasmic binding protein-like II [Piromyces finnis]